MTTFDRAVEAGARAMCADDIRMKRRWDTEPGDLARMLPAAVDYAWPCYVDQTRAALLAALPVVGEDLMQVQGDVTDVTSAYQDGYCEGVADIKARISSRLAEILSGAGKGEG